MMDIEFDVRADEHLDRSTPAPVTMYLESDFFMDVDDVGALAIAMNLHRERTIDLAGFGVNADDEWGAACAAILRYVYDLDFPIGVRDGILDEPDRRDYTTAHSLSAAYAGVPRESCEDGTVLLRRVLGAAPDNSITMVSVGFMRNLVGLLASGPDDHAACDGIELIRAKVRRTVMMGGVFPSGREHNLKWDPQETQTVLARWPTAIDFVGLEAASRMITARELSADLGPANPVAMAYGLWAIEKFGREKGESIGRPSWDPLAVYLAAYPDCDLVNWSPPGHLVVDDDGVNRWQAEPSGRHRYVIPRVPETQLAAELDLILRKRPVVSAERAHAVRRLIDSWATPPYRAPT